MTQIFAHEEDFAWSNNPSYPESLKKVYRYRLIVDGPTLKMGTLELDPGATYPAHHHPASEVYYLVRGQARWEVDGDSRLVSPGAVMQHKPGAVHAFSNIGSEPLKLVWVWYPGEAPADVLNIAARLVDR